MKHIQPCLAKLLGAIVQRRKAAGLSQAQLANRVRYQPSYLSKAERGLLGVPSQSLVAAIDAELNAGGALVELRRHAWLEDKGGQAGVIWRGVPEEVDITDRRQLIVGGGAVAVGPAAAAALPAVPALSDAPASSGASAVPAPRSGAAGPPAPSRIDLSGRWWTSWQTFRDGEEIRSSQEVSVEQAGEVLHIEAVSRGLALEEGGYLWSGELRVFDNEIVMGWYVAVDGPVRSKGTLFLSLHPHGDRLTGRWVGLSFDGLFIEGWGAMARSEEATVTLIDRLKKQFPKVA
ncbi:helix-turn-helix domain-containing protein [Frankia sp. Mgl5]|uniref:helix-turn-helix domain-containing protein n=1 Tax=Frankia sp. Mgl5 TaxID=2933793 RepID=UPI00200D3D53|nr:helix-turn-helix transcriptional regulator [Frankia sp. Mgl5]MCK9925602.1 helix-turn-helix domain-containing protein [Frankia sp. Mgl5]